MRTLILFLAGMLAAHAAMAGGLDTSFGTNGLVTFDPGNGANFQVHAAILQSDGKIVAVGTSPAVPFDGSVASTEYVNSARDFLIVRFNSMGAVDTTFGQNGIAHVDFYADDDRATGVVQQPDGKLVVVGTARTANGDFDYAVTRLNSDGSLDTTFGTEGKVTLNQAWVQYGPGGYTVTQELADNVGAGVVLLPGGKLAVAGNLLPSAASGIPPNSGSIQLFRLMPDGSVDSTYNPTGGGFVAAGGAPFGAMSVGTDGTLTVVGIGAVHLAADGTTYLAPYPAPVGPPYLEEILTCYPQSDGTMLFGGGVFVDSPNPSGFLMNSLVTRVDSSFKPNPTFAANGTAMNFAGSFSNIVNALVTEPSGNIFAVGTTVLDSDPLGREVGMVARLLPNGTLDANFSSGGIAQIDFDSAAKSYSFIPTNVLRTSDGKIIVVGNRGTLSATDPADAFINGISAIGLARLNSTPEYSVPSATISVSESAGSATLQITRTGTTTDPVSVNYATVDGSAVAGTDYTAASGTVTWQPADSDVKAVSISIADGHLQGSDKQFTVRLSDPTEGSIVIATATISVKEDDAAAAPVSPPASGGGSGGGGAIDWLTCLGLAYIGARRRSKRMDRYEAIDFPCGNRELHMRPGVGERIQAMQLRRPDARVPGVRNPHSGASSRSTRHCLS